MTLCKHRVDETGSIIYNTGGRRRMQKWHWLCNWTFLYCRSCYLDQFHHLGVFVNLVGYCHCWILWSILLISTPLHYSCLIFLSMLLISTSLLISTPLHYSRWILLPMLLISTPLQFVPGEKASAAPVLCLVRNCFWKQYVNWLKWEWTRNNKLHVKL